MPLLEVHLENKTTLRPTPQLAFGLIVILLGILFTLDNLDLIRAREYIRYWPALLLVLGVYRLVEPGDPPNYIPGLLFSLIGGVLLLNTLHFHLSIGSYWPLLLVLVGLGIISHAFRGTSAAGADAGSTISAFAFLSGIQKTCRSQSFRAGELTAVMGGCEIDMRQADIQSEEAVINIFSFWGGIELRVPDNWIVRAEVLPIMGGCDDHAEVHGEGPHKRLVIKGLVIMGGVEVRN
jgi:hypothetical protein